jgi:predicted membrane-bound spermidine synthase
MHIAIYFGLFFISGIAGLIYESIWSHYLKLFLGHAAYSQSIVLVIYMGGMALGSWLAAAKVKKSNNLLVSYAIVEIFLGFFAILFHDFFLKYLQISYDRVIPVLNSPFLNICYKWITASLIIFPQSVLLGATFPLMAAGFIRKFSGTSGYKISFLYFTNTLGASAGVLLSGFYLVDKIGLKGTIITGGVLDILVGITVFALCRKDNLPSNNIQVFEKVNNKLASSDYLPLLLVSGATAASSFMYEIGWIRMLSLVLGSSTHSFELMLSAFIFGMALGSFFIRNKIDKIRNIPAAIVLVQVIMGITALLTIFTYNHMFSFMSFIMAALSENEQGYLLFNLFSHSICLLVMLPSTICAGMVLPLIVHLFYRDGYGEESIGKVYAVNTFGSIVGTVIATWILMPLLGLRLLIITGGIIDIGIGLYILYNFKDLQYSSMKSFLTSVSGCFIAITVMFGSIDPLLTASGVFRNGTINRHKKVIFNKDGKTASVSLFRSGESLILTTNGKPDASVNVKGGISGDEYTMALTAVLPLACKEGGSSAAVIGLGSGMTSHYLLYDSTIKSVDVVEIEPAIVQAAKLIGEKVSNSFTDKRCNIYIDDAKTFFSAHNRKYDIIISEPSNPWVSGVSSLFSKEFFGLIKNHLNKDGILVQWFHKYESDVSILVSIFKALREHFPHYMMYTAGSDLITIATIGNNDCLNIKRDIFQINPIAKNLKAMELHSINDLRATAFVSQKLFNPLIDAFPWPANSDYYPFVDLNAVKYRFIDKDIRLLDTLRNFIIPVRKIVESDTGFIPFQSRENLPDLYNMAEFNEAKKMYNELMSLAVQKDTFSIVPEDRSDAVIALDYASINHLTFNQLYSTLIELLEKTTPFLSVSEMRDIWEVIVAKTSGISFDEEERKWMNYFEALCSYNMPLLYKYSRELLPSSGPIEDDYINRFLMVSLNVSAWKTREKNGVEDIWRRFDFNGDSDIMNRISNELLKQ